MSGNEGGEKSKGGKRQMSKQDCDIVEKLLQSGYHVKLTQKLEDQYNAISSRGNIRDAKLVKEVLSCIAYTGFAIVSGCRPNSCLKIRGGDLELIISEHPSDNMGEDDLDEGLVEPEESAICINFNQSKTRKPKEYLLVAEFSWEEDIIKLIHGFVSDARFNIGEDDLLFDMGATCKDSLAHCYAYARFARTVLTMAAFECDVSAEVNFELLRKIYACSNLQNMLEAFDIGQCMKGSKALRRKCRAYLRQSLKDVSKRLGHVPGDETRKLAPYINPRLLVEFAHKNGYHRFSLSAAKAVIKLDGEDHPWLSDSDEDDDDYKKAEDDYVCDWNVSGGKRGRQEDEGDY